MSQYWQLGQKDEARQWYYKSVEWMGQNAPNYDQHVHFRAEAKTMLGISDMPTPDGKEVVPVKE